MRRLTVKTELTDEVGQQVLEKYNEILDLYPGKSDAWHLRLVAEETGLRMDMVREVLSSTVEEE